MSLRSRTFAAGMCACLAVVGTTGCPGERDTDSGGGDAAASDTALPGTDAGTDAGPPMCIEDPFEDNDSCNFPGDATPLIGLVTPLGLCGDEDWFEITTTMAPPGTTVTATLTHDPAFGDLDIEIVDGLAFCAAVASSTNAGAAVETVTAPGAAGEFRCIRVFGHDMQVVNNNYTLEVMIQ